MYIRVGLPLPPEIVTVSTTVHPEATPAVETVSNSG